MSARRRPDSTSRFTATVFCPRCGARFDGVFHAESTDDPDPPVAEHRCPECGYRFAGALTDWPR